MKPQLNQILHPPLSPLLSPAFCDWFWRTYHVDPTGLIAHFDMTRGRGGDVQTWPDRENGNDLEQTAAGNQTSIITAQGKLCRHFDGSDFMAQSVYDTEQGNLTFVADGGSAEFRDDAQDFSDWETTSGNAVYCIVIVTDNGISWGYCGASNNGGQDIDVYTDKALTSRGWKQRTTPQATPDTPASYEIRKSAFNITGDFSLNVLLRLDDGQPAANNYIFAKHIGTGDQRAFVCYVAINGKVFFFISDDGTGMTKGKSTTAAVFPNNQTGWHLFGFSYDATAQTIDMYVNGSLIASTLNGVIPASIIDSSAFFELGSVNEGAALFFNGDIAAAPLFSRVLTDAEQANFARAFNLYG